MRYETRALSGSLKGFLLGAAAMLALVFIVGMVNPDTSNVVGNRDVSFNCITSSSDGNTVYATDNFNIYRSTDGGNNWSIVLKRQSPQP